MGIVFNIIISIGFSVILFFFFFFFKQKTEYEIGVLLVGSEMCIRDSSRILKLMNRRYDKEHYLELVDKIRAAVPDIALTTDIIVGFPGETEEDFEETMDVVRKVRYDSAFTFIYSKRTGTPAAVMEDQIPEDVIKARFDRLLKEVQTISAEKAGALTGQTLSVLIEEKNEQDASLVTGRLSNNSVVHLPGTEDMIGKIVNVKLLECKGFYYMGECI